MDVVCDVAGSVDAFDRRTAVLVDQNPVVDPDAAFGKEIDNRFNADTDDSEIALEASPTLRDHTLDSTVSLKPQHEVIEDRVDTVLAMNHRNDGSHVLAKHPKQWCR